jgi:hypothetical protein
MYWDNEKEPLVEGPEGKSHGYLNYKAFKSDKINEHMNRYVGENRLIG